MGALFNYLLDVNGSIFSKNQSFILYISSFGISILISYFYVLIKELYKPSDFFSIFFIRTLFCILIAIPIASVFGHRGINVGWDTYNYIVGYKRIGRYGRTLLDSLEIGFTYLHIFSYRIFNMKSIGALYPMSFFTVFFISYGLDLWEKKYVLPFGLFLFYSYFGLNMQDQARQMLAISIVSISYYFYYSGEYRKFTFWILFATLFHTSSILILVLLGFRKINFESNICRILFYVILLVSIIALFCGMNIILSKLPSHYQYLLLQISDKSFGKKWIIDVLPFFITCFLLIRIRGEEKNHWGERRIGFFTLPFRLGGYKTYFIMRLLYYPGLISILTACCELDSDDSNFYFDYKYRRLFLCLIFFIYFVIENYFIDTHNVMHYQYVGWK
ncbi:MAG: EpsG family protein [Treponema sp.]|nr:EpsG family protein [Treponema sp.]